MDQYIVYHFGNGFCLNLYSNNPDSVFKAICLNIKVAI